MRMRAGCAASSMRLNWPIRLSNNNSQRLAHPHRRGISLGRRSIFLSALWTAAYFASRFFLIVCNPRPPCFAQVGTSRKAMFRHRRPVQRAIASHSRLLVRPRLNLDATREACHTALPDPEVLPIARNSRSLTCRELFSTAATVLHSSIGIENDCRKSCRTPETVRSINIIGRISSCDSCANRTTANQRELPPIQFYGRELETIHPF